MTGFRALLANEVRLYLREPWMLLLALALPLVLLVGFGLPAPSRRPDPDLGGLRQIDTALPSLAIAISFTMIGLFGLPTFIALYRETGWLRRLSTTPVSPSAVLGAQLVIQGTAALVATVLLMTVGALGLGMAAPASAVGLVMALLLGVTAALGLGLVIAAVATTTKMATGLAFALMVPSFFLGGVYVPRQFLADWLREVGDWTPVGALRSAVEAAASGRGGFATSLVILAGWSVLLVAVARWRFRWQ